MEFLTRTIKSPVDLANALGITRMTGLPTMERGTDDSGDVYVRVDFPGVTLTDVQRVKLMAIAAADGWGELV
jgi:hypothetical protein